MTQTTQTQIARKPNRYNNGESFTPAIAPGQQQYAIQQVDPQVQRSLIERVLSTPAPVPARNIAPIHRDALTGLHEKSTPRERAAAAVDRAKPVMLIVCVVGIVVYVGIGYAWIISLVTVAGCLLTLAYFNRQEYANSVAGVQRDRDKQDAANTAIHEADRHTETMTAIQGDIELKRRMLEIAAGKMRGGDHD